MDEVAFVSILANIVFAILMVSTLRRLDRLEQNEPKIVGAVNNLSMHLLSLINSLKKLVETTAEAPK